jgi:hypothetical protein
MTVLVGVLDEPVPPGDGSGGLPQPGEMCEGRVVSDTGVTAVRYSAGWDGCASRVSRVGYWVIRSVMNASAGVADWG